MGEIIPNAPEPTRRRMPGEMEPITLPSGEIVGLSEQARMFLLHGVLPYPYIQADVARSIKE